MRASIITDQISGDLHTAFELLNECNCREFELRRVTLDAVAEADERWLEIAEKAMTQKRFRVTQIATDFFLKPITEEVPSEETVRKLIGIAKRLNCARLSIFGGHTDDLNNETDSDDPDAIALPNEDALDAIGAFVEEAEAQKIEIVLRTKNETCAGTVAEGLAIIEEIGAPNLGLDWDVGESFAAGDGSGLESIEEIMPVLKSVHLCDGVRRGMTIERCSLGKGVIPWEDIVDQLQAAGFRGPVIVDHGIPQKLKESRHALVAVMRWIDAARMKKRGRDEE